MNRGDVVMSWLSRITNVFRSDRLDQDLDDEQRFHLKARADELEERGVSREALKLVDADVTPLAARQ